LQLTTNVVGAQLFHIQLRVERWELKALSTPRALQRVAIIAIVECVKWTETARR